MERANRTGPGLLRRVVADAIALGIGAAFGWFWAKVFPGVTGRWRWIEVAVMIALVCAPFVGVAARDALLRRWGEPLLPARTPRNLRSILAWMAGYGAAAASLLAMWCIGIALGATSGEALQFTGFISLFTAPTVGVLVTRGLCRRWSAPPASATPPAAPAPAAPAPLPARPAEEPPGAQFLTAPA